ncbi:MAG TPA: ATP-dependent protease [Clostridiales bacterium]|nr:ATP-dependent protease [Clostridiales bacterium]
MKNKNELNYKQLKMTCDPDIFKFDTTEHLEHITTGIGQDRGIKALEFGVNVDIKGYNLYIEGPNGVGKTMYTKNYLKKIARKKKVPQDWCYIYNFNNPNEPIAVSLPAGQGKEFKEDMEEFTKEIKKDIKNTFSNEDFEKEKTIIKQEFEDKRAKLMEKLEKDAMEYDFQVKSAQNGIYMMPVLDGKALKEEEFDVLDEELKAKYEEKSETVQQMIMDIIGKIKQIERMSDKKINEWQSNVALLTVNVHINLLKTKYKRNKKINKFLNDVKQDVLKNVPMFLEEDTTNQQANQQPQMPQMQQPDPCLNYRVNLFVDNSELEGAPVIMDSNYSYQNIFGKLEYENYYGTLKTDFTMLKAGLLHKANGGYIMFQARDLLTNGISYTTLKKALRIKEIAIENTTDQATSMAMVSLKPEPIPLDLKVMLIGDSDIYQTLLAMDSDFKNLFKIKVEWEEKADLNEENANKLARIIHDYCEQAGLLPLDKYAMAKVVEYTSRMCGDQTKISTLFNDLFEVIGEASTWAKIAKSKLITADFIEKALFEQKERVKKYDAIYTELIRDNSLLISTTGSKVGELNGLTVMTIGNSTFGKPAKITVNTYTGKSGIINIEREVEMSGSTHSKGVFILSGYLGEQFAQDIPLSLTASICFEQLYNGVDGDSASSTELYGLLSSLSEIPINQSIAVTGSVNQKGQIQPIGGVNEKIEGFYQICKMRGLDGSHGVMIPVQNVKNLQLSDEIIDSVKNGLFKIYAISTIDEGIEVLTGVPAGKKDKQGKFPKGTVNYLVYEKLKKYAEVSNVVK